MMLSLRYLELIIIASHAGYLMASRLRQRLACRYRCLPWQILSLIPNQYSRSMKAKRDDPLDSLVKGMNAVSAKRSISCVTMYLTAVHCPGESISAWNQTDQDGETS